MKIGNHYEANTKFEFKLFSRILQQETNKNVFLWPTSVALTLSITDNGSSGETQAAIAEALELQGMSLQEVNPANPALNALLENANFL